MRFALLIAAIAIACASAPTTAPRAVAQPADLPRSSIAAVLLHREELRLTATQVDALGRRDEELQREDAALRARLAAGSEVPAAAPQASMTGAGRGGRHGGRRPSTQAHAPDLLTRLDDDDTRAYLEVEAQVLTEQQRPRAQQIASQYREALYDRQHPSRTPREGAADAGWPGG